jgi:hypothetical protein
MAYDPKTDPCNHCDSPLPKAPPWSGVDAYDFDTWNCEHEWVTVRVGDVQAHPSDPDEPMVYCTCCHAPRCGHSGDADPCLLPRHHLQPHEYQSGAWEPVGA